MQVKPDNIQKAAWDLAESYLALQSKMDELSLLTSAEPLTSPDSTQAIMDPTMQAQRSTGSPSQTGSTAPTTGSNRAFQVGIRGSRGPVVSNTPQA